MVRIAGLTVVCGPCSTVWTHRCDKGVIYRAEVCLWYHVDVGDSLNSHKSKPQLLKRKWSEDMTRNVLRARAAKVCAKACAKACESTLAKFRPKIAKAAKATISWSHKTAKALSSHSGRKTAKVTHI